MNSSPICPLDGTSPIQPYMHIPGDRRRPSQKVSYDLYWCSNCEYGILYPRPLSCAEFYDTEDGVFYTRSTTQLHRQVNDSFFNKLLLNLSWRFDQGSEVSGTLIDTLIKGKGFVCDLGCGSGKLLSSCQKSGHTVLGVEPDDESRDAAISRGLDIRSGTAENLPADLPTEAFDVVVMTHALEHCIDVDSVLANVLSLLKPGGYFVCEVPNNECIGAQWSGAAWAHLGVPRHVNFFTTKSLIAWTRKANMTVISTQYRGYCRQFAKANIDLERKTYDFFVAKNSNRALPIFPSIWTRWLMLVRSIMLSSPRKYDSVCVISCK